MNVDALVTCLARFIHPTTLINREAPQCCTYHEVHQLEGLEAGEEDSDSMLARVRVFLSPSFPNAEFHSVRRYYKVTQEGPRENLFGFEKK